MQPYALFRAEAAAAAIALKQNGTKRNLKLLSFGDEVEEEELQSASAAPRSKMISAHDVLDDPRCGSDVWSEYQYIVSA